MSNLKNKKNQLRAVIYARYSDDNQRVESIEGQIRECTEFANEQGYTLVGTYTDKARTGKTEKRVQFQKMYLDSKKDIFDIVIVWKIDRFARKRDMISHYRYQFEQNGVSVVSAKEPAPEGSSGIMLKGMLEVIAEFYSAELSEKVNRGMKENALKQLWNGGHIPFGYRVNAEQRLEVDPIKAPLVKEIFKMCYDGKTVKEIHRILTSMNVLNAQGEPIAYSSVRYILSNRIYIGEYRSMDVVIENGIEAIIDKELFEGVQREIEKNAHAPARHTADEDYLLTTKLFCGKCGAMMVAQAGTSRTGKLYRYYACTAQKKHKCDKKMISKEKLESFIVNKTMGFLSEDAVLEQLAQKMFEMQSSESSMIPVLEEELKEKNKAIENILKAVEKGLGVEALLMRLEVLQNEKNNIELSLAKEKMETPLFTKEQFLSVLRNFSLIDIKNQDGQRKIIDTFINSIYAYEDYFKIVYNGTEKEEIVSLKEIQSSTLFSEGEPKKKQIAYAICFFFHFSYGDEPLVFAPQTPRVCGS